MKKIILLIMFILCLFNVNADVNATNITQILNVTYNISELPMDGTFYINFSLLPNESISFGEISNDEHTNLNYPSSILLDENTDVAEWYVNYSIPFFADYSGNETLLEDIIGVTNSVNNNLLLVKLQYLIFHPSLLETPNNESYLILKNGGKDVEIYAYSIVDFEQNHEIEIIAPYGDTVDVTCGKYITCQPHVNVTDVNNKTKIIVNIKIPQGELAGNYTSFVTMKNGNNSGTINFDLIVRSDDVANLIVYDVWEESCYDNPENLANCYKKQARYNSEVANSLLARLNSENYTCDYDTIINETIKYVEVGNVDPDLIEANKEIREKYNTLSTDYTTLSSKYTNCMDKKTNLGNIVQKETEELSNEFILKKSNLEKGTILKEEELKKEFKSKFNMVIGWLFIIFLVILFIGIYLESQWIITNFPKEIFGIICIILFICWVGFNFFI